MTSTAAQPTVQPRTARIGVLDIAYDDRVLRPRPWTAEHAAWAAEVLGCEPQQSLRLKAHGWPAGAAEVLIELAPSGDGTEVTIQEDAVAGPARLVPAPVRQIGIVPRNKEALRRLSFLAERRTD